MLSGNDEQSGAMWLLIGLIVLVFSGVFLSLVADKRFSFSKGRETSERIYREEQQRQEHLKASLKEARADWERRCVPLLGQDEAMAGLAAEAGRLEAKAGRLREQCETLEAAVADAENSLFDYRSRYRMQVRASAAGEELGDFRALDGKIYKNARIRRVSATGLEIRHDEGNSRFLPSELEEIWNERFQWDEAELEAQLKAERERERRHHESFRRKKKTPPRVAAAGRGKKAPREKPAVDEAEQQRIEELRQAVIETRRRLSQVESEAVRARTEARTSKGRSVPGSLETWAERTARLEAAREKLRAQYISARGKLAAVAPGDSLLRLQDP